MSSALRSPNRLLSPSVWIAGEDAAGEVVECMCPRYGGTLGAASGDGRNARPAIG